MKVLVVNAFGLPPPASSSLVNPGLASTRRRHRGATKDAEFVAFCSLVASALKQIDAVLGYKQPIPPQCHLVSATNLHGILCDSANAQVVLDESARASCAAFDSFDMVFIGSSGNSKKMLPWDASLVQLGTLQHMCNLCGKPCFTVGCAALLEVYTLALRGKRIHPLNGARGSSISKLPQQPVFARPPSCCFLDNETGDLYSYVESGKRWTPTGNVGLRIVSLSGEPTSPRLAPPERRYASTKSEKLEEVVFDRDCIITVDVRFGAHPLLKNLGRHFVLTHLPEWHIQRYNNQMPFTVLGDSKSGPILIQHQLKTVLAVDISTPHHQVTIGQLLSNFVFYTGSLILGGSGNLNTRKMEAMLFGGRVPVPDPPCHPSLAKQPIQSILPEGPYEIPPPPLELFTHRPEASLHHMMMTEGRFLDNPKRVPAKNPGGSSRVTGMRITAVCRAANEDVPQRADDDALTLNIPSPIRPAAPAPSKKKMVVPGIAGWERLQGTPTAATSQSQSQSQSARTNVIRSEQSWLPVRHPETCRTSPQSNDLFLETWHPREKEERVGAGASTPTPHSILLLPATPFCSPVKKPLFSSYRKFAMMCANDAERGNTESTPQSTYRDGEYLSPHERLIKEYVKAKARFVHPEKRGMVFGGKASQLPLREEGQVRPHGPYLEPPRNQGFSHMKSLDVEILRVEDRAKHLAGQWKKH